MAHYNIVLLTYLLRQVIESYISNGSTVNMCTLDLSKAFDRTNHYALLIKLMHRNFPVERNPIVTKAQHGFYTGWELAMCGVWITWHNSLQTVLKPIYDAFFLDYCAFRI